MIKPSIEELSRGVFNRYELVIATAKTAHLVTDEYVKQRAEAERRVSQKETDKPISSMINRELRDEKAVKNAIRMIYDGEITIVEKPENH